MEVKKGMAATNSRAKLKVIPFKNFLDQPLSYVHVATSWQMYRAGACTETQFSLLSWRSYYVYMWHLTSDQ